MATNHSTSAGDRFRDGVGNAREDFHAEFALMSSHSVDTTRIEPWQYYLARLDGHDVALTAEASLRALWAHAHREHTADRATGRGDEDMRAVVEQWFERAQRRVNARPGCAPPEPTPWRTPPGS